MPNSKSLFGYIKFCQINKVWLLVYFILLFSQAYDFIKKIERL